MFRAIALTTLLAIGLSGCASSPPEPQKLSANQDTCWVCVHERDLACMKVDIDDKTPTAVYEGKTYHFCSEECKNKFVSNPVKYAKLALAAPQTQPAHQH